MTTQIDYQVQEAVVELYLQANISVLDISEGTGVAIPTIYKILHEWGVELRGRSINLDDATVDSIIEAYQAGAQIVDLEEKYNIAAATLYKCLRRHKVPLRNRKWKESRWSHANDSK